jgi:hypothetical protein
MEQHWVTCDFENGYPEDVKVKVLERWDRFGLESEVKGLSIG